MPITFSTVIIFNVGEVFHLRTFSFIANQKRIMHWAMDAGREALEARTISLVRKISPSIRKNALTTAMVGTQPTST
jgi:hypothetical protein